MLSYSGGVVQTTSEAGAKRDCQAEKQPTPAADAAWRCELRKVVQQLPRFNQYSFDQAPDVDAGHAFMSIVKDGGLSEDSPRTITTEA